MGIIRSIGEARRSLAIKSATVPHAAAPSPSNTVSVALKSPVDNPSKIQDREHLRRPPHVAQENLTAKSLPRAFRIHSAIIHPRRAVSQNRARAGRLGRSRRGTPIFTCNFSASNSLWSQESHRRRRCVDAHRGVVPNGTTYADGNVEVRPAA